MLRQLLNLFKHEAVGLLKRVPDPRDLYFKDLGLGEYQRKTDFKLLAPIFIENQHRLNVCWAEAWANSLAVYLGEQVSVRWITGVAWYRRWCGTNGAQLKVAGDIVRKRLIGTYGFLTEKEMPSDETLSWEEFTKIDIESNLAKASPRAIGSYYFCETPDDVLQSLDNGYPVVIGRYWTNKFDDGFVLKPDRKSNMAHATLVVGYKGDKVIEANSWGKDWGDKGLFYTPINQLQKDIDDFGAIAITNVPYTPKAIKISQLQAQLKVLKDMIKKMLEKSPLVMLIESKIGTDASPKDLAPDKLACAETVSTILREYFATKGIDFPVITGTYTLWREIQKRNDLFRRRPEPVNGIKGGDIIISPTVGEQSGHTGFFLDSTRIASNSSLEPNVGKFIQNYTRDSWRKYFHVGLGLNTYVYEVLV